MLRRPAPDSLWADANWRRYWLSRVISYIGGTITYVAAPILVYSLTHSALLTGVTTATEGLPYLLFGLYAGAIADRIDRRRMMVSSDFINAFVLATVPIAEMMGRLTVVHVILVGFVSMSADAGWQKSYQCCEFCSLGFDSGVRRRHAGPCWCRRRVHLSGNLVLGECVYVPCIGIPRAKYHGVSQWCPRGFWKRAR